MGSAIGVNTAIFALWRLDRSRVLPRLRKQLSAHTICSLERVREGRIHTLLTSTASHQAPVHFCINTYGLFLFGSLAAQGLSSPEMASLLAVSGVGASLTHVLCHPRVPVIGSSGALMGLLTVGSLMEPGHQFLMLLPVPGMTVSMLQLADLAFLTNVLGFFVLRHWLPGVAWAAHLGGTAAGFGFATAFTRCGDSRFHDPWSVHARRCKRDWLHTVNSFEDGCATVVDRLKEWRERRRW